MHGVNGTGTNNTSAPVDDPGWDNVGIVNPGNPATGVYLGNYSGNHWMLTANHVVLGSSVILTGNSYNIVANSAQQVAAGVDLKLFQIATAPVLPTVTLSTQKPLLGEVVMIGYGKNQLGAQLVEWDIDTAANPDDWTTPPQGQADASGYQWGAHEMRWGTNTVWGVDLSAGATATMATIANDTSNPNEAQASLGDSGGGVFYKNGGNWELAGIMISVVAAENDGSGLTIVNEFDGQPPETAIYSYRNQAGAGSVTQAAQIADYKADIEAKIMPIPEPSSALLALAGGLLAAPRRARRRRGPLRHRRGRVRARPSQPPRSG